MSKVAVVYWSSTGHTETMAEEIAAGAKAAGAEVETFEAANFTVDNVAGFDALAFGCPAMGDEELEGDEFLPMWDAVKGSLSGKKVALFGSYGWGDGDWMNTWKDEAPCEIFDTYICCEEPDDDAVAACKALGGKLAE